MIRTYTGWDKNASGRRAGTEKLVQFLCYLSGNGLWNNGTWGVRPIRGSDKPSVHGTGRAIDLSWRKTPEKGYGDYNAAKATLDFCVKWADLLCIEEIHDYYLKPYGRGWRCDRAEWKVYDKPTIGSQGGDWFHIEISNDHADDPAYYAEAFKTIFTPQPAAPSPIQAPIAAETQPTAPKVVKAKPLPNTSKATVVKPSQ